MIKSLRASFSSPYPYLDNVLTTQATMQGISLDPWGLGANRSFPDVNVNYYYFLRLLLFKGFMRVLFDAVIGYRTHP